MERIKKLHISVSESLFNEIREYNLLVDIDNIVGEMLIERIETIKRGEQ
jgi:hypothetical protein